MKLYRFFVSLLIVFTGPFVKAQIISTAAGIISGGTLAEGVPATTALLGFTSHINFDDSGYYYFGSNLYKVRKISPTGIITTVAGNGVNGYSGDGGQATAAKISLPSGVAVDAVGNLYIGDMYNHRIRKVNKVTGIITTIAGDGTPGFFGDGGLATSSKIHQPIAITFDTFGNLYFADAANYRIRMISTSGIISTIAGTGLFGSTGDGGPATAAEFAALESVRVGNGNNLYIAESEKIRKINLATGLVTCIAGTGVPGYSGDGGPATAATLLFAADVLPDNRGNVYISEGYNHTIRKVDTAGIIYTIAGTNIAGYSGDGGPATAAQLNIPEGVALDVCGNLFISDGQNGRIRRVTYPPVLSIPTISLSGSTSYPVGGTVSVTAAVGSAGTSYIIHWLNHGLEFTTTTVPTVTYTKGPGVDTITARIVPTGYGCWDSTTSSLHIIYTNTTSVSNMAGLSSVVVYPNPASNSLTIANASLGSEAIITNMVGQQILRQPLTTKETTIDIAHLPAGIYIVKVAGDGVQMITRIVKE